MNDSASSSYRSPDGGQHAGAHGGLTHPAAEAPGTAPSAGSGQDQGQALKVVCSWCATVLRAGVEPVSHGICTPCKDRQSLNVLALSLTRARTDLLTLQAAILILVPYIKRYSDRGWPSLEEYERGEASLAFAALRVAVGDDL